MIAEEISDPYISGLMNFWLTAFFSRDADKIVVVCFDIPQPTRCLWVLIISDQACRARCDGCGEIFHCTITKFRIKVADFRPVLRAVLVMLNGGFALQDGTDPASAS